VYQDRCLFPAAESNVAITAETADTLDQRQALRRHRAFATALLVAMALVYIAITWSGETGFWIGLARAGAEAAMVGGLADWFAVTALFRRPLGLPIPHTAVIPASKDRIGTGLGNFIERHFLEPELVGARLRSAGISRRLGLWLADSRNADVASDRLLLIAALVLRSLNDANLQRFVQVMLRRELRKVELAPALATLLDLLRQNGAHQIVLDHLLDAVRHHVAASADQILEIVEQRSRWWVPKRVDRRMAAAITEGIVGYMGELKARDHTARATFDAAVARLVADLRGNPDYAARVNALRDRVLASPEVADYLATLWRSTRGTIEQELAAPRSRLRQALSGILRSIGAAIAEDAAVQASMDERLEETFMALVVPFRKDIGRFVADVVKSWEASTIVDRVELAVGKDLQFIRVNGTLVGAAVGCAIYVGSELVR
jgi:uncharacterized membrane-anchored protein YjiN (DUF445 family)